MSNISFCYNIHLAKHLSISIQLILFIFYSERNMKKYQHLMTIVNGQLKRKKTCTS